MAIFADQSAIYAHVSGATTTRNVTLRKKLMFLSEQEFYYESEELILKLLNYDKRTLILQNVRTKSKAIPDTYSKAQYQILCNLIRQKGITEPFFQLVLSSLFDVQDWKELNYQQMYELIHTLTYYDYGKERI